LYGLALLHDSISTTFGLSSIFCLTKRLENEIARNIIINPTSSEENIENTKSYFFNTDFLFFLPYKNDLKISRREDPLSGRPDGYHTQENTEVPQSRASGRPSKARLKPTSITGASVYYLNVVSHTKYHQMAYFSSNQLLFSAR